MAVRRIGGQRRQTEIASIVPTRRCRKKTRLAVPGKGEAKDQPGSPKGKMKRNSKAKGKRKDEGNGTVAAKVPRVRQPPKKGLLARCRQIMSETSIVQPVHIIRRYGNAGAVLEAYLMHDTPSRYLVGSSRPGCDAAAVAVLGQIRDGKLQNKLQAKLALNALEGV